MSRPTPETDASCGYALSSHYGRLEGSYLQMDWSGPFVHAEVARKLERERDEARSELSLKQQTLTIAEGTLSDLRKQRDEWSAMCGRYKQERDEVKEKYRFAVIHWQIGSAKMERERDEWKNKAYSHATDYTLMEAKCFRLEQQLKEYDKLKS